MRSRRSSSTAFATASDAEVRYLNFHAPGQGFADYMRGLSDFDQADPPDDGGRPASEAAIAAGEGVLCEVGEIGVAVRTTARGRRDSHSRYVLEGELLVKVEGRGPGAGDVAADPARPAPRVSGSARHLEVHTPA